MKSKNITYIFKFNLIVFSIISLVFSCSKEASTIDTPSIDIPEGYAAINIETIDIQFEEEKLTDSKKASVRVNDTKNILHTGQPSTNNNSLNCIVSFEPESSSALNKLQISKSAVLKTSQVERDIRYRIYVYNKTTGKLVTSKSYIRGTETAEGPLMVFGGQTYTIVAYSINSKTNFPAELDNAGDISTATVSNEQVEFMFQKQDVNIAHNSNNTIKLKFRHQFAQINTIIKLDNSTRTYTYLRGAGGASYFKPSYSKTKFKVSNSEITADESNLNVLGSPVQFPFINTNNTSTYELSNIKSTVLNTPSIVKDGIFTIEALTIGDISRRVEVGGLNVTPGVKYNLVLTFNVPETTLIGANPDFHFYDDKTSGIPFTHEIKLENPTYGAQIDIYYLDNSFNLNINGTNLFSRELNFEGFPYHDVYFSDNTYYGMTNSALGANISTIYNINKSQPREKIPVVRLTIDENGNVKLYGRKRMSENLRELQIRNGVTINTNAKLKHNEMNTLIFSSTRWTITDVEGKIYGIRIKNQ